MGMRSNKRERERSFYSMDPQMIIKDLGFEPAPKSNRRRSTKTVESNYYQTLITDARDAMLDRDPSADVSHFDHAIGGERKRKEEPPPKVEPESEPLPLEVPQDKWSTCSEHLSEDERSVLEPVVENLKTPGAISDHALVHFHREVSEELDRRLRTSR
jgi:hypothetical protein